MSKTIELQIEKSRALIAGLRKHLETGVGGYVDNAQIDEMERQVKQLVAANEQCDQLRAELSPLVRQTNQLLAEVKNAYSTNKKTLKGLYPQEQWAHYGVPDKR